MDSQSRNKKVWTGRVETKKYGQLEQKQNSMDSQSRNKTEAFCSGYNALCFITKYTKEIFNVQKEEVAFSKHVSDNDPLIYTFVDILLFKYNKVHIIQDGMHVFL